MTPMEIALEEARAAAARGEVPVGAVVTDKAGQVLARAGNEVEARHDPSAHAEMLALREAARRLGQTRLGDCTLTVTLEPCPMCAGALVNARLGKLVYGATDPKAGACETLYAIPGDARLNHRVEMHGGVLAPRCVELLRAFFKERRAQQKALKSAQSRSA